MVDVTQNNVYNATAKEIVCLLVKNVNIAIKECVNHHVTNFCAKNVLVEIVFRHVELMSLV
jgi:hypothetical protein